ncbi:hypothetical protein F5887DRAFT_155239 [Amanita rubescens]|nr:hypothetical protein F5887DRAFT_155239 [Amanita rubescens]
MKQRSHEEPVPESDVNHFAIDEITLLYDGPFYLNKKLFDFFGILFRRALKYTSNPRNLEALWKPVYFVWLDRMASKYANLVCFQEQPVWSTPKPLDPDRSITGGKGQFITLFPDLGIARIGEDTDVWLLLCELKRSPRRAYMKQSLELGSNGWQDLLEKMRTAISQVQRQAFIALHKEDDATEIFLLAACGPFWTYVFASREQIEAFTPQTTGDQEEEELSDESSGQLDELEGRVLEQAEILDLEKSREVDGDEDLVQEDVLSISSGFEMTREHLFGTSDDNNDLGGLEGNDSTELLEPHIPEEIAGASLKAGLPWADVMVTGSTASNKGINDVRGGINQLMKKWADTQKKNRPT